MEIQLRTTGCCLPYMGYMGSHSITCHPTQANTPRLNPAGEGWYSIYRPRRDGRLSWPRCLITRGRGIEPKTAGSEVRHPNHCATKTAVCAVRDQICLRRTVLKAWNVGVRTATSTTSGHCDVCGRHCQSTIELYSQQRRHLQYMYTRFVKQRRHQF